MVLLIAIIVGVAVFCFVHGYIAFGIVCLLGFSNRYGWPALLATSAFLFWNRHWFVASLPPLLIVWNIWGVKYAASPAALISDGLGRHGGKLKYVISPAALISTMKQQAASGNPLAQPSLGGLYFDGLGVPRTTLRLRFGIARWLNKATPRRNTSSGFCTAMAWVCPRTTRKRQLVSQGDRAGRCCGARWPRGGCIYADRPGRAHDYAEAYFWFDLAAAGKLNGGGTGCEVSRHNRV